MSKKVLWITQTGVLVALLIVAQFATAPLGNTLITGSIVNLLLITSVMVCGISSGTCVALISPIFAKLIGIGPLWSLIPFIMLGNLAIIVVWFLVTKIGKSNVKTSYIIACLSGAIVKFLVLYVGIVQLAVPILLKLEEPAATAISASFSVPQLITALVGGAIACLFVPIIRKAVKTEM